MRRGAHGLIGHPGPRRGGRREALRSFPTFRRCAHEDDPSDPGPPRIVPAPRGTDHLELAPAERVEWVAESVTLDPLEMLARLCQHLPPPGLHPTRMQGAYAHRTRGARARRAAGGGRPAALPLRRDAAGDRVPSEPRGGPEDPAAPAPDRDPRARAATGWLNSAPRARRTHPKATCRPRGSAPPSTSGPDQARPDEPWCVRDQDVPAATPGAGTTAGDRLVARGARRRERFEPGARRRAAPAARTHGRRDARQDTIPFLRHLRPPLTVVAPAPTAHGQARASCIFRLGFRHDRVARLVAVKRGMLAGRDEQGVDRPNGSAIRLPLLE